MATPDTPSSDPNDRSEAPWIPSFGPPPTPTKPIPLESPEAAAPAPSLGTTRIIGVPVREVEEVTALPVERAERVNSIDVLRGVAVLGILLMNIVGFGLPFQAYSNPTVYGGASGLNFAVWFVNDLFFEGTFRALFSMLFGAGVILITRRAEARGAQASIADVYYRRTIWLIVFGVVHSYVLLWLGEILYVYGIVGLFLFPVRRLKPLTCLIVGLLILWVVSPTKTYFMVQGIKESHSAAMKADAAAAAGETLTEEQTEAQEVWKDMLNEFNPDAESLQRAIEGAQGGYVDIFIKNASINVWLQSAQTYKDRFWDALGMMLLGMAFMKWGILSAKCSGRFYMRMMLICYGIGLAINTLEMIITVRSNFQMPAMTDAFLTYDFGRVLMSCGHIAAVMLLCQKNVLHLLLYALAAVGRMALTNYLMQTIICNFIFLGFGLGMFGKMDRWELYGVVLGIWVVQLLFSPVWLKFFRFGPAEWLWRSLTYWKLQPILATRDTTSPSHIAP